MSLLTPVINPVFNIQPAPIFINGFRIQNITLVYNLKATIYIELLIDNQPVLNKILEMTGEEYQAWNSDDPYLSNWICQQLNFSLV